jgi:predicted glycosyltransferase involved in capsule biosynthesis
MPVPTSLALTPALSIIIPFRDEGHAPWLLQRLEQTLGSFPLRADFEAIVVDSGSLPHLRPTIEQICSKYNARLIHHHSTDIFSIGATRDFGARHAKGRIITFYDVDWRASSSFWPRLITFSHAFGVGQYKSRFFVVPVLYLSESATNTYLGTSDPDHALATFCLSWLYGLNNDVITLAPCSSIVLVDRLHYLSIGGHDADFRGHGYEDFELFHRLLSEDGFTLWPNKYFYDSRSWSNSTYTGFRAAFSLLGRAALMQGLFAVHLWHPRPRALSFYSKSNTSNYPLWQDKCLSFNRNRKHPQPLAAVESSNRNILLLLEPNSHAANCLRDALPVLGNPLYEKEVTFTQDGVFDEQAFQDYLTIHTITLIVFHNPYANKLRLTCYQWCRANNKQYLVFERGALTDSWFFDAQGFNADSKSYSREIWDIPLSESDTRKVEHFIHDQTTGSSALETQGIRVGGSSLRKQLKIGERKVLFVPLQRPSDTVTTHMAGESGGCRRFLECVDEVARLLYPEGWTVLCKKHPLESASPPLIHARYVPDDVHFLDLVELASQVLLINSGVGIYAMMMEKPCIICGNAFYSFEGLNYALPVVAPESIVRAVKSPTSVNVNTMKRFIFYLAHNFYSFGKSTTHQKLLDDGSYTTVTTSVRFYQLILPNCRVAYEPEVHGDRYNFNSPLFDGFRRPDALSDKNLHILSPRASARPHSLKDRVETMLIGIFRGFITTNDDAKDAKLQSSPYLYFADAKQPVIRLMKFLFRKKHNVA